MSATATIDRGAPRLTDYPSTLIAANALRRARDRVRPTSPAALAKRLLPGFAIVPATALISDVLDDAIRNTDRRYVVSMPPRTGKSLLASVIAPLFALARDPDATVIVKSYGDQLAEEHSGQARRLVTEHGALLGFEVDQSKSAIDRWLVAGHRGGVLAGGIASPATGFGVSRGGLLVVDDPIKGAAEADSPAHRRRLLSSFRSDLLTRLHPGASVVVLATRWAEDDLSGSLLADADPGPDTSPGSATTDTGRWTHVNVPAISTAGVRDDLHREPGRAVTTALGFTAADFDRIRLSVGSRAWAASYLGTPAAPEGNVILAEWIDSHRLPAAPARPSHIVVAVDPADSGHGDETGIVAGSLAPNGTVCLIADVSARLTSDAWANRTVELAVALGASAIVVEGFSAATTYSRLVTEALRAQHPPHHITVSTWPPKGRSRVGDALARSQGMVAALENGRCRVAGHLPDLEADMTTWQPTAHQPDRVAAAVIAFDVLADAAGQQWTIVAPVGVGGSGGTGTPSGGDFLSRLGRHRPAVDAMVAEAGARKRAEAAGTDPGDDPEVAEAARVVNISAYLSQRASGGNGYDPLANYGPVMRDRQR